MIYLVVMKVKWSIIVKDQILLSLTLSNYYQNILSAKGANKKKKKTMLVGTLYSLQYGNLKILKKNLLRNNRTFNNA